MDYEVLHMTLFCRKGNTGAKCALIDATPETFADPYHAHILSEHIQLQLQPQGPRPAIVGSLQRTCRRPRYTSELAADSLRYMLMRRRVGG